MPYFNISNTYYRITKKKSQQLLDYKIAIHLTLTNQKSYNISLKYCRLIYFFSISY